MISHDSQTIYFMGIGGIAMGTLATMLKEKGYNVVGSDQNLYPPMSTHLEALGIPVLLGYDCGNPARFSPDLFIIGNVIRRDNPEAQHVLANNLPHISMPQAIEKFFLKDHKSMVAAGTHGKSTTSSLLSWVLACGDRDPSAFIGAFLNSWQRSYRLGNGPYMVLEGDEYDTAFFDKGPKFLHYRPYVGIITSIEFDHADIFADFEAVFEAFRRFVHLIPSDGHLIANADDPHCVALSRECKGNVLTYGWSESADWRIHGIDHFPGEIRFLYTSPNSKRVEVMRSKLPGRHNTMNALSVMIAASIAGLSMEQVQEAFLSFKGVKRRQDIIGEYNDILIMDDFAHHPTAVQETVRAIRDFYPGRRIIAAFEPRTNSSRRNVFHDAYAASFDDADCICIKQPAGLDAIPDHERLDTRRLVEDICLRQKDARFFQSTDELLNFFTSYLAPGDLVLCMSNGSFDGLPQRLAELLNTSTLGAGQV
jgi:UDP-N-acetylmuramate: L-alanyl-gamma-D-glutamyl-meso-diaminopimelate ligase